MQAILKSRLGQIKTAFALCVMVICGGMLWQHISDVPREDITQTFQKIGPWQWAMAGTATLISFMAVGRYDAVWHARLGTGVPSGKAARTGMAAIAIGQTIGAGAVTGAFVRWHAMPQLGFKTTTGITIGVSLSFLACWALLGVGAGIWLGLIPAALTLAGIAAAISLGRMFASNIRPHMNHDIMTLFALTAIDVGFAGLALWVLLPEMDALLILPVLAAYIISLGAGLISNAPGGLGAFDLCLIALLPALPEADMLAAILAFRIVYYLIPAILAATFLVMMHLRHPQNKGVTAAPISDLCQQGAKLRRIGENGWVLRKHLLGTVALEANGPGCDLRHFRTHPFGFRALYKADGRLAQQARAAGWAVRRIAEDALIDPTTWSAEGAKKRQLRRKLSQAEKSGVHVYPAHEALPLKQMSQVAAEWAAHHGGELGYSMGRYSPDYVAAQRVYLIMVADDLRGFITVQTRPDIWAIDVIRHGQNMPTGAIHAAYAAIIADAKTRRVGTVSLGAVPTDKTTCKHQLKMRASKAGLIQFKQSFRPQWKPLYHAAPTPLQWTTSMLHVIWHVQRPLPRLTARALSAVKSLIMISPIFHLNAGMAHDISRPIPARAQTNPKAVPHDERIRNASG